MSPLSNIFRLTERLQNLFIVVNSCLELSLKFILGHSYQEVANKLWYSLSNSTEHNLEVGINSSSNFLHKEVSASLAGLRLWWLLVW